MARATNGARSWMFTRRFPRRPFHLKVRVGCSISKAAAVSVTGRSLHDRPGRPKSQIFGYFYFVFRRRNKSAAIQASSSQGGGAGEATVL